MRNVKALSVGTNVAVCWFTLFSLGFSGSKAHSQSSGEITESCLAAVEAGDLDEARVLAEQVKGLRALFSTRVISRGEECLRQVTGEEWAYFTTKGRFLSGDEADAEESFIAGAEDRKSEKLEALEVLECELSQARFERDLLLAEFRALSELRESELQGATIAACSDLYDSDANAALLNQVCSGVFAEWGLPNTVFRTDWDLLQAANRKIVDLLLEKMQVQGRRASASVRTFLPSAQCRELLAE